MWTKRYRRKMKSNISTTTGGRIIGRAIASGDRWRFPQEPIAQEVHRKTVLTEEINKSHLRSMKEVTGYTIQATDSEIGHVDDFIIDDESMGHPLYGR